MTIVNQSRAGGGQQELRLREVEAFLDRTSPPTATAGRGAVLGAGAEMLVEAQAVPDMSVRVQVGGTSYNHLGERLIAGAVASLAISAADPADPRIDIIVLVPGSTPTVTVREGTPAGAPADPALSSGDVPLARVAVAAAAPDIQPGDITDLRSRTGLDLRTHIPGTMRGIVTSIDAAASPYTVDAADEAIFVDSTGGPVEIRFPAAAGQANRFLPILHAAGADVLTLNPDGAELIDSLATITVPPGSSLVARCDGAAWSTGAAYLHDHADRHLRAGLDPMAGVVADEGAPGVGHFRLTGNVADTETVTLGAQIYEFDDNGAGNFPGGGGTNTTVQVDVSGGLGAANAITQLVAAINADPTRESDARDLGGDVAGFVALAAGDNPALATMTANGLVSDALSVGGVAATAASRSSGVREVTAEDVLALASGGATGEIVVAAVPSTTAPVLDAFMLQDAAGAFRAPDTLVVEWRQFNANFWGLVLADPLAVLAATNTIRWIATRS